jgi:hypothetical protein
MNARLIFKRQAARFARVSQAAFRLITSEDD